MFHRTGLWYAAAVTVMIGTMIELLQQGAPSPTDTGPPGPHRGTR